MFFSLKSVLCKVRFAHLEEIWGPLSKIYIPYMILFLEFYFFTYELAFDFVTIWKWAFTLAYLCWLWLISDNVVNLKLSFSCFQQIIKSHFNCTFLWATINCVSRWIQPFLQDASDGYLCSPTVCTLGEKHFLMKNHGNDLLDIMFFLWK